MSSTVDERIVDMQFNNQQFEKNVHQSIDTIGDLKKSLNFSNVSDGVGEINRSIGKISFDPIASGLNSIGNKFSIFETIAVGALLRIGQKAEDLGEKLVKSLTIDQISSGWNKYADKTTSVQTIMAATADQFEDTGEQMEYVNEQLDRLNWFTDETSYNFTDMTSNIGKFTSNGVKLDDAVSAMQGIATWAAISGQNAGAASRAMYNLSQAMSAGAVKRIDWNSIENANMGTKEFKETAIELAASMGTLKKAADGTYRTLEKGTEVNFKTFRDTLTEGWFTSDVLMKTLDKYGGFSVELAKVSENTGLTATELLQAIDDYKAGTLDMASLMEETGLTAEELEKDLKHLGSSEFDLGRKALKAAQEAKTFSEAIDATKDAVSTGWMNTFEIIFGDYEEAKVLWTALANELYDIFAEPINARNEMLTKWKELGGQKAMLEALKNAWLGLKGVVGTANQAFRRLFPKMTAERLVQLTESFKELTSKMIIGKETGEKLGTIFRGLFAPLSIAWQGVKALVEVIGELIDIPHIPIIDRLMPIARWLIDLEDYLKKNDILKKKLEELVEFLATVPKRVDGYFRELTGMGIDVAIDKLLKKVEQLYAFVRAHSSEIIDGIKNVLGFIISVPIKVNEAFEALTGHSIIEALIALGGAVVSFVQLVVSHLDDLWIFIKGFIGFIKEIPETINVVFQTITGLSIGDVFDSLKQKGEALLETLKEVFGGFADIDTSGAKTFSDKVQDALSPLADFFEGFRDILSTFWELIKTIAGVLFGFVEDVAGAVGDAVGSLEDIDADGALSLVNGALGATTVLTLRDMLDSLTGVFDDMGATVDKAKGVMDSLKGMMDEMRTTMVLFQKQIKAKTLESIATSIALITASIVALTMIDQEKLSAALGTITMELIELMWAFNIVGKNLGTVNPSQIALLISIGTALGILTGSVAKLAELDWDEMAKGLLGMAGMIMLVVFATNQLSSTKPQQMVKGTASLISFAVALRIMASALTEISYLDWGGLAIGVTGLGAIMLMLLGFMEKFDQDDSLSIKTTASLILLAAAVKILASAVADLGSMSVGQAVQGILALGVLLTELRVFIKKSGDPKHMFSVGLGLILLGAAMKIMASAVEDFGRMDLGELAKGLIAMGIAVAIMMAAMKGVPKNASLTAPGLVLVAAAIKILASALSDFGKLDLWEIAKGLAAMFAALFLAIQALQAVAMIGPMGLVGAAALTVMAVAITILAGALKILGSMSVEEIIKSLITLAVTLTTIAVLSAAFGILSPLILAFGVSLALVAASVFLLGTGVTALSIGLTALGGSFGLIINGILDFVKALAEAAPEIFASLSEIAWQALDSLQTLIPKLVETVFAMLTAVLAALVQYAPQILGYIMQLIGMLLVAIRDNAGSAVTLVVETLMNMIDAVIQQIPTIVNKIFEFILALINGLADAIRTYTPQLIEAVLGLVTAVWLGICDFLGIHSPSTKFFDIAINCIKGVLEGLASGAADLLAGFLDLIGSVLTAIGEKVGEFLTKGKEFVSNIVSGIYEAWNDLTDAAAELIGAVIETIGGLWNDVVSIGSDIIGWIGDGIDGAWDTITSIGSDIVSAVSDGLSDLWDMAVSAGEDIINGLVQGIEDIAGNVADAVEDAGNGAIDALLGLYGIASPSKVTAEIGRYFDEGLVVGINEYSGRIVDATESVGDDAIEGMSKTLSKASDILTDNIDAQPTIRPVVDLTDVTDSIGLMNGMFDNQSYSVGLAGNAGVDMNARLSNYQDGLPVNNNDVVNAIGSLGQQVTDLSRIVGNLQVVMDTGALVGSIANPIDQALGAKTIKIGRGM